MFTPTGSATDTIEGGSTIPPRVNNLPASLGPAPNMRIATGTGRRRCLQERLYAVCDEVFPDIARRVRQLGTDYIAIQSAANWHRTDVDADGVRFLNTGAGWMNSQ